MPSIVDKYTINNPLLDKRVKLTPEQKQEIIDNLGVYSQRELARMYNVSRRTIQFTQHPEKLAENIERRNERGGSKEYYNKEKQGEATKKHRAYKKELLTQGKLTKKDNNNEQH